MMKRNLIKLLVFSILLNSCGSEKKTDNKIFDEDLVQVSHEENEVIKDDILTEIDSVNFDSLFSNFNNDKQYCYNSIFAKKSEGVILFYDSCKVAIVKVDLYKNNEAKFSGEYKIERAYFLEEYKRYFVEILEPNSDEKLLWELEIFPEDDEDYENRLMVVDLDPSSLELLEKH